jgi:hypothetical protein
VFETIPVIFRSLASHEQAFVESWGKKGFIPGKQLSEELAWGTASLKGATSWIHTDDDGFGTVVRVRTGCKYWVLMRKNRNTPQGDYNGNMATRHAFGKGWDPLGPSTGIYEKEGVLLTPDDVL